MLVHLKILISKTSLSNVTLQESAQKVKKKELLRADFCFEVYQLCTRQYGNTISQNERRGKKEEAKLCGGNLR